MSESPRGGDPGDRELLIRAARDDTDAFRELFDRKHRRVFRIAYQMLGDRSAAEDVVQETFLALWRSRRSYRARFAVNTWLNRIATNKAIDRWRSERRRASPLGEGAPAAGDGGSAGDRLEAPDADPTADARWQQVQAIWDEIATVLPAQQRAAFVLRVLEELPVRDVAAALGCSRSTVRSHISLARKELRRALGARYPELIQGRDSAG